MADLTYKRMTSETDGDIPLLTRIFALPEVSRYVSISEAYFRYVTHTPNVYFYKAYENGRLIGTAHLEKQGSTLYMSVVVFPPYQGKGLGKRMVKDVRDDAFGLGFGRIEVSIDESNEASRKVFESAGFIFVDQDGELFNYIYERKTGTGV
jgi:RimJ/RimL family protein N-acetyltransferase